MRRFGRVTCCGGETRLLFRFAHLQHWMAMMPPNSTSNCAVLLSARYQCCMSSLTHLYIYIVIILFIHASHTGLLPACRWVCALLHTEGCCSIMSCAHPDTSVCFASLPFSAITYAAGYTVGTHVLFSQVCLTACQGAKTGAKRIGWDGLKSWLSVTARLGVFAFPRWLCTWSIYTQEKILLPHKKISERKIDRPQLDFLLEVNRATMRQGRPAEFWRAVIPDVTLWLWSVNMTQTAVQNSSESTETGRQSNRCFEWEETDLR